MSAVAFFELAVAHQKQVSRALIRVSETVAREGIKSDKTSIAIQSGLFLLNHRGFHFNEWELIEHLFLVPH
jgi:hypothetical protein